MMVDSSSLLTTTSPGDSVGKTVITSTTTKMQNTSIKLDATGGRGHENSLSKEKGRQNSAPKCGRGHGDLFCDHCHRMNHNSDRCWVNHGYPTSQHPPGIHQAFQNLDDHGDNHVAVSREEYNRLGL